MPEIGDFGLSKGGGIQMWFVRLGTFSRYGHAALVLEVNGNEVTVIEAMPGGVRTRVAHPGEFEWSCLELTHEQRQAIVTLALTALGRGYDWPSIFKFLPRFFGAKIKGGSSDHEDKLLFCSEYVTWVYRDAAHRNLKPGFAPDTISPGDLTRWLCQLA